MGMWLEVRKELGVLLQDVGWEAVLRAHHPLSPYKIKLNHLTLLLPWEIQDIKKRLKMAGLNEQIYYSNNKVQKELLLLTTRNWEVQVKSELWHRLTVRSRANFINSVQFHFLYDEKIQISSSLLIFLWDWSYFILLFKTYASINRYLAK